MPKLPDRYLYLDDLAGPRVINEALALYGTYEYHGEENNPIILSWAKELGRTVGIEYSEDSIPWCGLFVGVCVKRAGFEPVQIAVRAKAWRGFGTLQRVPKLGDILIFNRAGGGHVGFYVGEDQTHYHVLGGNQSDQVNIARLEKTRLLEARRCPWGAGQPSTVERIFLNAEGPVSENEA